jgi:hypothetical protein
VNYQSFRIGKIRVGKTSYVIVIYNGEFDPGSG